jgi:hypothetical protein
MAPEPVPAIRSDNWWQLRRRPREETPRPRTVRFDLTEAEFAELAQAASRAGLAKGAYADRDRDRPDQTLPCAERHPDRTSPVKHSPGSSTSLDLTAWVPRAGLMIGKITEPRGERVEPLIYYLYGPGRHEEHTDPHIVAGWRHPAELEPPLRANGTRDFRRLFGLLNQPDVVLGKWGFRRPVWHLSMRAAPRDKVLSEDEWAQIAGDVMNRTGLSPYGQEDDAVRWIAVRHGDDQLAVVEHSLRLVELGPGERLSRN